ERERKYVDVTPRTKPEAMIVTDKEATNSMLAITFPYAKNHETTTLEDYKKDLAKGLALQILNRRFNDLSQGSNPPFPVAGADFDDLVHGYHSFNIYAMFNNNGLSKALNAVTAELVRAKKYGFTENELELAKK